MNLVNMVVEMMGTRDSRLASMANALPSSWCRTQRLIWPRIPAVLMLLRTSTPEHENQDNFDYHDNHDYYDDTYDGNKYSIDTKNGCLMTYQLKQRTSMVGRRRP